MSEQVTQTLQTWRAALDATDAGSNSQIVDRMGATRFKDYTELQHNYLLGTIRPLVDHSVRTISQSLERNSPAFLRDTADVMLFKANIGAIPCKANDEFDADEDAMTTGIRASHAEAELDGVSSGDLVMMISCYEKQPTTNSPGPYPKWLYGLEHTISIDLEHGDFTTRWAYVPDDAKLYWGKSTDTKCKEAQMSFDVFAEGLYTDIIDRMALKDSNNESESISIPDALSVLSPQQLDSFKLELKKMTIEIARCLRKAPNYKIDESDDLNTDLDVSYFHHDSSTDSDFQSLAASERCNELSDNVFEIDYSAGSQSLRKIKVEGVVDPGVSPSGLRSLTGDLIGVPDDKFSGRLSGFV